MSQKSELSRHPDYFAARAVEERRHAMASSDPKVRAIHLDLAEKYSQLAAMGAPQPSIIIEDQQKTG
jgi:hypothetical protein